jgi:hypothetical protein
VRKILYVIRQPYRSRNKEPRRNAQPINGMNAEECADKQGEPPIRHAGELCSYDAAARQRAPIGKICDRLAILLYASCAAVGATTSLLTESSTPGPNQRHSVAERRDAVVHSKMSAFGGQRC